MERRQRLIWVIERKPLRASNDAYRPHENVRSVRLAREKVTQYNRLIADCEYRLVCYVPETP